MSGRPTERYRLRPCPRTVQSAGGGIPPAPALSTPRASQTHSGLNSSLAKLPVVTVLGQAPVPIGLGLLIPFGAERKTDCLLGAEG